MRINASIIGWILGCVSSLQAVAQTPPPPPPPPSGANQKQTEEIIIRKNGEKDTKVTVEITGDKVLINGKPLAEFNEEGITINKRKMIMRDGEKMMINIDGKMIDLDRNLDALSKIDPNSIGGISIFKGDGPFGKSGATSYTFLGVSTEKNESGAAIVEVSKESPAEKAELQKGDIIYKVNDTKIDGPESLSNTIRSLKEGDKVKVYYWRAGKKKDVKITLGVRKEIKMIQNFSYDMPNGGRKMFSFPAPGNIDGPEMFAPDNKTMMFITRKPKLGLKIQDIEEGNGVKVIDVESESAAATAGIKKDDIITAIAGKTVQNTDEAREQLQQNKEVNSYDVQLKRNGTDMKVTIKIPKKLKTADL